MEPGERVTLIRRAAGTLHEEELAYINLTLREFRLPTDFFVLETTRFEYLLDQLGQGSDGALTKLDAFLHDDVPTISAPPPLDAGGPWKPGAFRLFLSHTHEHAREAGELREILGRWGVDLFVAHDIIEPLAEWQGVIEDALRTCFAAVALVTPDFIESKWCDQEVGFALGRGLLVVPLMRPAEPYGLLGKYQGLRVGSPDTPHTRADKLYDRLATHELTRSRMAPAVVRRFAASGSFDDARRNFARLRTVLKEYWTGDMAEEARRAAKANNQIEHAIYDSRPIPDLLEQHLQQVGFPLESDDDIPF